MNVLIISNQKNNGWSGPTHSIPRQVEALSRNDNVFWYNLQEDKNDKWSCLKSFHNTIDYPEKKISSLPKPFNRPDIIVIEQFYAFGKTSIIFEIIKCGIPYLIIPRGELTKSAQNSKRIKKFIANLILFRKFAKKASGIIYLTKNEAKESGDSWNNKSYIIPNGVEITDFTRNESNYENIRCISIGRIAVYHKGIDMLIDAIAELKEELLQNKITIDYYGPDYNNELSKINIIIQKKEISGIIKFHPPIYGEEKKQILKNGHLFILTSRFEGHPMALIEALSFSLPCIVTSGSNMSDEIETFDAGWTSNNSVEGIKKSFLNMIKDKNILLIKGINAKALSQKYDWSDIAKNTKDIFLEVISERRCRYEKKSINCN